MVKKIKEDIVSDDEDDYDSEEGEELLDDEEKEDEESVDSDIMIAARDAAQNADQNSKIVEKFGMKAINDEEGMLERLKEIQSSFYNRLESKKLIKKQGKIPFTEHMTISK